MTIDINNRIKLVPKCKDTEDCPLCLTSLTNCLVARLPCGHLFHNKCYENLVYSDCYARDKCALCRLDIEEQNSRKVFYDFNGNSEWNLWFKLNKAGYIPGTPEFKSAELKERNKVKIDAIISELEEELEEEFDSGTDS